MEELNNKFKIKQAGFLKTETHSCYHWHKDKNRGVCINSLVTIDSKSLTLFGKYKNNHNSQLDFVELKYKENKFYLFNNQEYHTVINFDKDRVIFTIEFEKNKNELNPWLIISLHYLIVAYSISGIKHHQRPTFKCCYFKKCEH